MKVSGNSILITGGGTGIGFSLAQAFAEAGNEVIICGRREERLKQAKEKVTGLHYKVCDVSKANERNRLYDEVDKSFKNLNILINNAGIQRMMFLKKGIEGILPIEDEIETNLRAPIHLAGHFIPFLMKKKEAAIVNVSSGLGFVPMAIAPVYSATKAALHSFTLSMRHQLSDTSIKVFEVIPPIVDTELDGGAREQRGQRDRGIQPVEVASAVLKAMEKDEYEIPVGFASGLRQAAHSAGFQEAFNRINH